jgi:HTH-type transcriptional regulator / antitoxin HigA
MKSVTENEYKKALTRIEVLLKVVDDHTPEDDKNLQELVALSDLVKDYEENHFRIGIPTLREVIQLRMFEMKLKQKDLAKLLNTSTSRISEYLSGKRDITMDIARALHKKLDIDPEIILQG